MTFGRTVKSHSKGLDWWVSEYDITVDFLYEGEGNLAWAGGNYESSSIKTVVKRAD